MPPHSAEPQAFRPTSWWKINPNVYMTKKMHPTKITVLTLPQFGIKLAFGMLWACLSWHAQASSTFAGDKVVCERGNGSGCFNVGLRYEDGDGVAKDLKKAALFYEKACKLGTSDGCINAAVAYKSGEGVTKDAKKAGRFFEQACKLGDAEGCKGAAQVSQGNASQGARPELELRDLVRASDAAIQREEEKRIASDRAFKDCEGRGQSCFDDAVERMHRLYPNKSGPAVSICESIKAKYAVRRFEISELEKSAGNTWCVAFR